MEACSLITESERDTLQENLQIKQTEKALSLGNNCAEAWTRSPNMIVSAYKKKEESWMPAASLHTNIVTQLLLTSIEIYGVKALQSGIRMLIMIVFSHMRKSLVVSKGTDRRNEKEMLVHRSRNRESPTYRRKLEILVVYLVQDIINLALVCRTG